MTAVAFQNCGNFTPINGSASSASSIVDGTTQVPELAMVGACMIGAPRGVSKNGVRRLTRSELKNSLMAVLPDLAVELQPAFDTYPDTDIVEDVERFDQLHSAAQVLAWGRVVDVIADSIQARGLITRIGDACLSQSTVSEKCWNTFFNDFGKKVFRRPLTPAEIQTMSAATLASLGDRPGKSYCFQNCRQQITFPDQTGF